MKLTIIILTTAIMQVSAATYAQKVTLAAKNAPIAKIFNDISRQTNYTFVYTAQMLEKTKPVTIDIKNMSLTEALDKCFRDQPLTYTIKDQVIIVSFKGQKSLDSSDSRAPTSLLIKGRVFDENGQPLVGATVKLNNGTNTATTNEKGEFTITINTDEAVLSVSYIGYHTQNITVNGSQQIFVVNLERVNSKLDEVHVIAYGTTTQRLSTGSIVKISAKELEEQPVANPLAALDGRVPGLIITQGNGLPGSSFKVQLRGQNSLAQGSVPLFIIDGVPFAPGNGNLNVLGNALGPGGDPNAVGLSPFNNLNIADIETIEVLKDADATSIYGSRGANGVILITTKKGKAGKTTVAGSIYTGSSQVTHLLPMMNTQQYLQMRHQAFKNDGITPDINSAPDLFAWDTTRYTNLEKLMLGGKASTTDVETSLSGGTANTTFLIGAGYHHETTVFPGNLGDARGSLHLALNHNSVDGKFNAAFTAYYADDKNNLIAADLSNFINLPPDIPSLYDANGNLNWQQGGVAFANPLAYLLQKYSAVTDNLLSNLTLSYKILPGLTARSSFGYNTTQVSETSITPMAAQNPAGSPTASSTFGNNAFKTWIVEPQLEYKKEISKGVLDVLLGGTLQDQTNRASQMNGTGYATDALLGSISAAGSVTALNNYSDYRYEAFFGRVNYNWQDKYIVNASARRDGSSRFGPGKQFGNFWSLGGAWLFSNENFIKDNLTFLSYGKLRASYGTTGNDQIGNYQYLDSYVATIYPYNGNPALRPNGLFNPDYSWEINKKLEAALELGFLHDRILLTASYFRNRSSNQLISETLPAQTGFYSITDNFPALVQNKGYEFTLTTHNLVSTDFKWSTNFNISFTRNKLVSFPGLENSTFYTTLIIGQPLSVGHTYHSLGVDPTTGVFIFQGSTGATSTPVYPGDLNTIVNVDPKFYGGFSNSLTFKSWQLDFLFIFKKQVGRNYRFTYQSNVPGSMVNQPAYLSHVWQKPGDNAPYQQFTTTPGSNAYNAVTSVYPNSDAIYGDASYIRLKNISLSYSLKTEWLKKAKISNLTIFALGQNLFTITKYLGTDPETLSINALPPLKTITAGLKVNF